jgi:hypothetical protein
MNTFPFQQKRTPEEVVGPKEINDFLKKKLSDIKKSEKKLKEHVNMYNLFMKNLNSITHYVYHDDRMKDYKHLYLTEPKIKQGLLCKHPDKDSTCINNLTGILTHFKQEKEKRKKERNTVN